MLDDVLLHKDFRNEITVEAGNNLKHRLLIAVSWRIIVHRHIPLCGMHRHALTMLHFVSPIQRRQRVLEFCSKSPFFWGLLCSPWFQTFILVLYTRGLRDIDRLAQLFSYGEKYVPAFYERFCCLYFVQSRFHRDKDILNNKNKLGRLKQFRNNHSQTEAWSRLFNIIRKWLQKKSKIYKMIYL